MRRNINNSDNVHNGEKKIRINEYNSNNNFSLLNDNKNSDQIENNNSLINLLNASENSEHNKETKSDEFRHNPIEVIHIEAQNNSLEGKYN